MKNILIIAGRELNAFLRSPLGSVVAAAMLFIDGLYFQAFGLGGSSKLSAQVLAEFFYGASGPTMGAAVVLAMRSIALEREKNTFVLLNTSPVRESQIVLGKYLALVAILTTVNVLSVYMPLLIFVNGKVSIGHIVVGYAGLFLLGSAAAAIGVFASSLARSQIIAVIVGALMLTTLVLLWMVAKISDPPLNTFLNGLALHHERFKGFMLGVVRLENVVFYIAVTYFFLVAAVKTLEARRWR